MKRSDNLHCTMTCMVDGIAAWRKWFGPCSSLSTAILSTLGLPNPVSTSNKYLDFKVRFVYGWVVNLFQPIGMCIQRSGQEQTVILKSVTARSKTIAGKITWTTFGEYRTLEEQALTKVEIRQLMAGGTWRRLVSHRRNRTLESKQL